MGIRIETQMFILWGFLILTIMMLLKILKKYRRDKIDLKRETVNYVFRIYISVLIGITLFPLDIHFHDIIHVKPRFNLLPIINTVNNITRDLSNPLMKTYSVKFWIRNIVVNIALFMPLGALLPVLSKKFDSYKIYY